MKFKVVLVEDDFSALTAIKNYCQEIQLEVVGAFNSPANFIEELDKLTFDIAILDYAMPQYNGLQLAEILNSKKIPIIFVTGHRDEIASKAWDMNCIACIEKPVNIEKLKSAIQKFSKPLFIVSNDFISLDIYGGEIAKIKIAEIAFITSCESDTSRNDKYLQTTTGKDYRIVNKKLETLINMLPQNDFMRISRYHIVSRLAIDTYSKTAAEIKLKVNYLPKNSCTDKIKNGPVTLSISEEIKDRFKKWISIN